MNKKEYQSNMLRQCSIFGNHAVGENIFTKKPVYYFMGTFLLSLFLTNIDLEC